jgi:hypothetical protein
MFAPELSRSNVTTATLSVSRIVRLMWLFIAGAHSLLTLIPFYFHLCSFFGRKATV